MAGKRQNKSSVGIKIMIGILVCVVLVYVVGIIFFHNHFVPGTEINGVNCSFSSVSGAEEKITKAVRNFDIVLVLREKEKESINGNQFDLDVVFDESMNQLLTKQNALLWPVQWVQDTTRSLGVSVNYDKNKLKKVLNELACMQDKNMREPEDAYLSYNSDEKAYDIMPEDIGTKLDKAKVLEVVPEFVEKLDSSIDLDNEGCYIAPMYNQESDVVKKAKEIADKYVSTTVKYEYGDDTVEVDSDQIAQWLNINKKFKISFIEDKVQEFVSSMAKKYDTIYTNRTFKTSYGYDIDIASGDYGWWTDRVAEKDDLINFIKAGKAGTKEPIYYQKAMARGKDDLGDSYVEVNLTMQHVLLYKNGKKIAESDCVTGKPATPTNTGIFSITYKDHKYDDHEVALVGENYVSQVNFFIPFNGNQGLHDASWRNSFGGSIYKRNGSHGCVNLPYSMASSIFDNVEKNMPVIVYEDPSVPSATTQAPAEQSNE